MPVPRQACRLAMWQLLIATFAFTDASLGMPGESNAETLDTSNLSQNPTLAIEGHPRTRSLKQLPGLPGLPGMGPEPSPPTAAPGGGGGGGHPVHNKPTESPTNSPPAPAPVPLFLMIDPRLGTGQLGNPKMMSEDGSDAVDGAGQEGLVEEEGIELTAELGVPSDPTAITKNIKHNVNRLQHLDPAAWAQVLGVFLLVGFTWFLAIRSRAAFARNDKAPARQAPSTQLLPVSKDQKYYGSFIETSLEVKTVVPDPNNLF